MDTTNGRKKRDKEGNRKGICEELKAVEGGLKRRSTIQFHEEELDKAHTGGRRNSKRFHLYFSFTSFYFFFSLQQKKSKRKVGGELSQRTTKGRKGKGRDGC